MRRKSSFTRASAHRGGKAGADLVGLRCAEVGVEGQGILVVLACAGGVAEDVVGVAEAGVGAGLLVTVAGVGGPTTPRPRRGYSARRPGFTSGYGSGGAQTVYWEGGSRHCRCELVARGSVPSG
jgi:hypothetical protein